MFGRHIRVQLGEEFASSTIRWNHIGAISRLFQQSNSAILTFQGREVKARPSL
jgi:hypothetical protein